MKQGKFFTLFSGLIIYSVFFSSIAVGQSISAPRNLKNDSKAFSARGKAAQTPSKYLRDITRTAEAGEIVPVAGVEAEVEKIAGVLSSNSKRNPVLIDDYATKRRLVVDALAVQMLREDAPLNLRGKRILKIDTSSLLADSKNQSEAAALFQNALDQISEAGGKTVLYLEDIATFAKENPLFGAEIADGLRRFVIAGKTAVISAGTVTDYQQQIAHDAQLKITFKKLKSKPMRKRRVIRLSAIKYRRICAN